MASGRREAIEPQLFGLLLFSNVQYRNIRDPFSITVRTVRTSWLHVEHFVLSVKRIIDRLSTVYCTARLNFSDDESLTRHRFTLYTDTVRLYVYSLYH